jgi:N6-adenosine-specific RNA methylase IME4
MSKWDALVVDPPWAYGSSGIKRTRTAERHYTTIGANGGEVNRRTGEGSQAIIDSVPIAEWSESNAHLYLWTTNPKLPFAFAIMAAWGFTYKTTLTWVKVTQDGSLHRGGMGWFFRGATEHVLFGVRGTLGIPSALRQPNVILAPPGEHSEKPQAFYDLVDRVSESTARKIDVFARKRRAGWDAWGNEL